MCGNSSGNKEHFVKEMMFGLGEVFKYIECEECGCLQIADAPRDMSKYYPENYYSFEVDRRNSFTRSLIKMRDRYELFAEGLTGKIIASRFPATDLQLLKKIFNDQGIGLDSEILDVGCGNGHLIRRIAGAGFRKVTGIDPYIEEGYINSNLKIFKNELGELPNSKKYDLIMFNHSYEHLPDQDRALHNAVELLTDAGALLVRMPVKSEYIWNRYGVDWVQIDAPRHIIIHTEKSFKIMATRNGMKVTRVVYDSTEFQFWGSEQYRKGIPLNSERSYSRDRKRSMFSKAYIKKYQAAAKKLNAEGNGDSAAFICKK